MMTRKQELSREASWSSTIEAVRKDVMTGAVHTTVDFAACVPLFCIRKTVKCVVIRFERLSKNNGF